MNPSTRTRAAEPPAPVRSLWHRARIPLLIFVISLGAYLGTAAGRLRKQSDEPHYVWLAQTLLEGRLSLSRPPPSENDWALVTELTLRDGRKLRGTFLQTGGTGWFKTTTGKRLVITEDMVARRDYVRYVSFPWFPAILMLPFVAIWKLRFNDVIFTCVLAAFNPVLVWAVLQRLRAFHLSQRSTVENLWLVALFAFGTVHFFASVMGQVWYTAHVVGVALSALYLLAALEGRHPVLAGLCLGLGFITRTPLPFLFPLVVGEILRRNLMPLALSSPDPCHRPELIPWLRSLWPKVNWRPALKQLTLAALPAVAIAGLALFANYLRFDNPFEFGHYYLNVVHAERIQRWGLFNYHFLPRNLAVMLTLLPRIQVHPPYLQIPWHGLGIFFTTPIFVYLIWPRRRSPVQPWLYLSCLLPIVAHLLYQNSGWVQFGYRFSLDYTVLLIALLAIGGYRLGWFSRGLIVLSIAINTFGAVTFNRFMQFYWDGMFPIP
jgi:hypothetical protein